MTHTHVRFHPHTSLPNLPAHTPTHHTNSNPNLKHSHKALLHVARKQILTLNQSIPLSKFQDYKWSIITEKIAEAEGLDFGEVGAFLFAQNPVEWFDGDE
jgi:hypothetical protein